MLKTFKKKIRETAIKFRVLTPGMQDKACYGTKKKSKYKISEHNLQMQSLDRRGKLSISSFVTVDSLGTQLTVQKSGMFAMDSLWDPTGGRDPPHEEGGGYLLSRIPAVTGDLQRSPAHLWNAIIS